MCNRLANKNLKERDRLKLLGKENSWIKGTQLFRVKNIDVAFYTGNIHIDDILGINAS